MRTIILGSRQSNLAKLQTSLAIEHIKEHFPLLELATEYFKTSGDLIQNKSLVEIGGKGLFVKELDETLLSGKIDLAVHSLKDVPAFLPEGLVISAVLPRNDPGDALISHKFKNISELPKGARIGTCAPRRKAQLLHLRPDLELVDLRGNIETRIRKLDELKLDAIILAIAGLKRTGFTNYHPIPFEQMIPAVGQGTIALVCRQNDLELQQILSKVNDQRSWLMTQAERAFLQTINGSCNTPLGALATIKGNTISLSAFLASDSGTKPQFAISKPKPLSEADIIGKELGTFLKTKVTP